MQTQTTRLLLAPPAMLRSAAALARRAARAASFSAVVVAATLLAGSAARAEKVPNAFGQEVLIKVSLLTFNDANVTGNYSVLHAKMSKPFREQFTPERLKAAFKSFADQKIDFDIIAAKAPVATSEARIDERGALILRGYFDTRPNRVSYELDFVPSEGEWKLIKLNASVNAAPAEEAGQSQPTQ